jgi:hypothetical protein
MYILGRLVALLVVVGAVGLGVWGLAVKIRSDREVVLQEFSPPGGNFTILMPPNPERTVLNHNGVPFALFESKSRGTVFNIQYADIPAGVPIDMDGFARAISQAMGGTYRSDGGRSAAGRWQEFEVTASNPSGYASGRVVYVRGRLYIFSVGGPNARLSDPDVRQFIDSFRLKEGPQP